MKDNIRPDHYRKGEIDLFEEWYLTYPFNEFRAIMSAVAERYMKRDKDNRIQDLDKAMETLKRLKEYEEREIEHDGGNAKNEIHFDKISKAIYNKKIKIAGFYQDRAYIRRNRLLKDLQGNWNKYLVRSKSGILLAYRVKVQKDTDSWGAWHEDYEIIDNDNFPEVKWTDDEPTRIVDLLATYENGGENGK